MASAAAAASAASAAAVAVAAPHPPRRLEDSHSSWAVGVWRMSCLSRTGSSAADHRLQCSPPWPSKTAKHQEVSSSCSATTASSMACLQPWRPEWAHATTVAPPDDTCAHVLFEASHRCSPRRARLGIELGRRAASFFEFVRVLFWVNLQSLRAHLAVSFRPTQTCAWRRSTRGLSCVCVCSAASERWA